jgi:hypothetical protein
VEKIQARSGKVILVRDPSSGDFECPEWSHLSAADSVEYTKRLSGALNALVGTL